MFKINDVLKIGIVALVIIACGFILPHIRFRPDLSVIGAVNLTDGIGRQSAELIETFKDDFTINFVPTGKIKKRGLLLSKSLLKILYKKTVPNGKVVIFEDLLWTPGNEKYRKILRSNPTSIRIAYSMWESSKLPDEWVISLNNYFDAVCVPAHFLIDVYKNSGVSIPIFELPLGRDFSGFLKSPLKEKCHSPMVFGNLSACNDRKNQIGLVRAFAKAFGNDPNVLLRINVRGGEKEILNSLTREITKLRLENILFTQFRLSEEEYMEEWKNIDCYVSPSKGEGFSLQPREAMILGIPVIATNNTGQISICESGLVSVINTEIEELALFPWGDTYGYNHSFEIDELANAMKEMKTNYSTYLEKREAAREWASQFHYPNIKEQYRGIIQPKKIVLSTEDKITEDCLYTTSEALYEKYQNAFKHLR